MDLEFNLKNASRFVENDLIRTADNFGFDFEFKDGVWMPTRDSQPCDSGWRGREMLLSFVRMVRHRRYVSGCEFHFDFKDGRDFTVIPKRQNWQPGSGSIHPFPEYRDLPAVDSDRFKKFFGSFMANRRRHMPVDVDPSFWHLSVLLCFEVAKKIKDWELSNRFDDTPVAALVMIALDTGQLLCKEMRAVFDGMSESRKAAAEAIVAKYTKAKFSSMLDELFEEGHLLDDRNNNEEVPPSVNLDGMKQELVTALTKYFEASIKNDMKTLFLGEEYVDADEESELQEVKLNLTELLRMFCYGLHGEYQQKEGMFDKSNTTKEEAKSQMVQETFGFLFKCEPDATSSPVVGHRLKRQRIVDDDDDSSN